MLLEREEPLPFVGKGLLMHLNGLLPRRFAPSLRARQPLIQRLARGMS